jgi:hypothetical protein
MNNFNLTIEGKALLEEEKIEVLGRKVKQKD